MKQELQYLFTLPPLMQADICAFVFYFLACVNTFLS